MAKEDGQKFTDSHFAAWERAKRDFRPDAQSLSLPYQFYDTLRLFLRVIFTHYIYINSTAV